MNEQRIVRVQGYLQAVGNGDLAVASEFLTPEVRLEMPGAGSLAGTYVGRDAFFAAFGRMMALTRGSYRLVEATEWLAGKSRVVLLAVESAERNGQIMQFRRAIAYGFSRSEAGESQIATVHVYELDPQMAMQAFAPGLES